MYKYIHIFNFPGSIFNSIVIDLINNSNDYFISNEHLFIVRNQGEYNALKYYDNVSLDIESRDIINRYGDFNCWIIVHGMPSMNAILRVKKKYLPRIIWRSWGSDTGYDLLSGKHYLIPIKLFLNFCRKQRIKKIHAVGAANLIDKIDLVNRYGKIKIFEMPYATNEYHLIRDVMKREKKSNENTTNVLIGHSGYKNDNHIKMIKLLRRYVNEDIKYFFLLAYGDCDYIEKVKTHCENHLSGKVIFIKEYLDYKDYIAFLNDMDIVILDGIKSYALGNIQILLQLKKKLFLNPRGVIRKAFDIEKIPYRCTNEIHRMGFKEFSEPSIYKEDVGRNLMIGDYGYNIEKWVLLFNDLKECIFSSQE